MTPPRKIIRIRITAEYRFTECVFYDPLKAGDEYGAELLPTGAAFIRDRITGRAVKVPPEFWEEIK